MSGVIPDLLGDVMALVLPRQCHLCGRILPGREAFLCAHCRRSLPKERFDPGSPPRIERQTSAVRSMRGAAAWLTYHPRGETGRLVHDIKYHGYSSLARYLGRLMALDMLPRGFLSGADCIVPVPVHFTRRLRRGYNQSEEIAKGVSAITGIPVVNALTCRRHKSQTRVGQLRRIDNVKDVYRFNPRHPLPASFPGQGVEVVLLDDVCTTGSTLVNAAAALEQACPGVRIRLLALCLTHVKHR